MPALALALKALIPGGFWMALVGGSGADGAGRYALVKARDGAVLADGDEAFDDRARPWRRSSARAGSAGRCMPRRGLRRS